MLGRWGDDLVYRLRTRSFDLRLRPPGVPPAGCVRTRGDTLVEVAGRFDPSAGTLRARFGAASGHRRAHRPARRAVGVEPAPAVSPTRTGPRAPGSPPLGGRVDAAAGLLGAGPTGRRRWRGAAVVLALGLAAVPLLLASRHVSIPAGLAGCRSGDRRGGSARATSRGCRPRTNRRAPEAPPHRRRA